MYFLTQFPIAFIGCIIKTHINERDKKIIDTIPVIFTYFFSSSYEYIFSLLLRLPPNHTMPAHNPTNNKNIPRNGKKEVGYRLLVHSEKKPNNLVMQFLLLAIFFTFAIFGSKMLFSSSFFIIIIFYY